MVEEQEGSELEQTKKRLSVLERRLALERIFGLLGLAILIGISLWYIAYTQRVSDQRWCDLMTGLDRRYERLQNPDPDAQEFAREIHILTQSLPCDRGQPDAKESK